MFTDPYTRCSTINPTTTIKLHPVRCPVFQLNVTGLHFRWGPRRKAFWWMYPDAFGTGSLHRCTPRTQYLPLSLSFSLSSSALYRLYRKLWPQLCRVGHVEAIKKRQACTRCVPIRYQSIPDILLFCYGHNRSYCPYFFVILSRDSIYNILSVNRSNIWRMWFILFPNLNLRLIDQYDLLSINLIFTSIKEFFEIN